ncbi:helix-turn-helix transcriptional regulator [Cohnella soli]|uniref:Helix-turn-helix transcriptional regulator n=1 Tax=Cohnella soli TaxID=425005 RepID=A0ABW0I1E3_9BACL
MTKDGNGSGAVVEKGQADQVQSRGTPQYIEFAERYGFNDREKEVLRLFMLFGLSDEEIVRVMGIKSNDLRNYMNCMLGKSRTSSPRELLALFVRYLIQQQSA